MSEVRVKRSEILNKIKFEVGMLTSLFASIICCSVDYCNVDFISLFVSITRCSVE